jgi:hypothetical protein
MGGGNAAVFHLLSPIFHLRSLLPAHRLPFPASLHRTRRRSATPPRYAATTDAHRTFRSVVCRPPVNVRK